MNFCSDPSLLTATQMVMCRFVKDPRRPYLARAVSRRLGRTVFLKRYDLSVWSGTTKWLDRVMARCVLIEHITKGKTRFYFSRGVLTRMSVVAEGFHLCGTSLPLSTEAHSELSQLVTDAHSLNLPHGDIARRNLRAGAASIDLFDWEPILLGPGPGAATEPVPSHITEPHRWLGGCDLITLVKPGAPVFELDCAGLRLLSSL